MKKLVTIISEQSIQNLIFLNYFSDHDEIIFISTIEMKNKGLNDFIINLYKNSKKCSCLIIDSEKPYLIEQALKDYNFNSDSLYSINITGGTKIMSLILYRFFSSFNHRNFYYLPINKSYMLDIEKEEADEAKIRLNDLVDIKSYLEVYGIEIKKHDIPLYPFEKALDLYKYYYSEEYSTFKRHFLSTRDLFHNKHFKIDLHNFPDELKKKNSLNNYILNNQIDSLVYPKILLKLSETDHELFSTRHIDYISGGWFEEYCYYFIKSFNVHEIMLNITVNLETKNEIDIAFIHKNSLFLVECKTSLLADSGNVGNNTLYKQDSIASKFGKNIKKILITLDPIASMKDELIKRSKQNDIFILAGDDVKPNSFNNKLLDILDKS